MEEEDRENTWRGNLRGCREKEQMRTTELSLRVAEDVGLKQTVLGLMGISVLNRKTAVLCKCDAKKL